MKKIIIPILGIALLFGIGFLHSNLRSNNIKNQLKIESVRDVTTLQFKYENDTFNLGTINIVADNNIYEYTTGEISNRRGYTFIPNDPTVYTEGLINNKKIMSFVLWRGSGANIIEPILFVFNYKDGSWQQTTYAKLPDGGGRTTIDSFKIENNSIILDVKTSGPDKNYHETYVPNHYVYKINEKDGAISLEERNFSYKSEGVSYSKEFKIFNLTNLPFKSYIPKTDWLVNTTDDGVLIEQNNFGYIRVGFIKKDTSYQDAEKEFIKIIGDISNYEKIENKPKWSFYSLYKHDSSGEMKWAVFGTNDNQYFYVYTDYAGEIEGNFPLIKIFFDEWHWNNTGNSLGYSLK